MSYPRFLKREIFDKLDMRLTVVSDGVDPLIPNVATSYECRPGATPDDIDYTPLNKIYGDDGVFTNLVDLHRWHSALWGKDGVKLVKPETLNEAFLPGRLLNGMATGYGFGWDVECVEGQLSDVYHLGAWCGYRTYIRHYFEPSLTVVVLSNSVCFDESRVGDGICRFYRERARNTRR